MVPIKKDLKSSKAILLNHDFLKRIIEKNKYIGTEHQDYGIRLASRLGDFKNKSLYMKYAKEVPRSILEGAAQFAIDYPDKFHNGNKGRIFMWKLKALATIKQIKLPSGTKRISKHKLSLKKQIKLI